MPFVFLLLMDKSNVMVMHKGQGQHEQMKVKTGLILVFLLHFI